MNTDVPAYGLWPLVVINAAAFIIFAFSFTHPSTGRDWRSFGARKGTRGPKEGTLSRVERRRTLDRNIVRSAPLP